MMAAAWSRRGSGFIAASTFEGIGAAAAVAVSEEAAAAAPGLLSELFFSASIDDFLAEGFDGDAEGLATDFAAAGDLAFAAAAPPLVAGFAAADASFFGAGAAPFVSFFAKVASLLGEVSFFAGGLVVLSAASFLETDVVATALVVATSFLGAADAAGSFLGTTAAAGSFFAAAAGSFFAAAAAGSFLVITSFLAATEGSFLVVAAAAPHGLASSFLAGAALADAALAAAAGLLAGFFSATGAAGSAGLLAGFFSVTGAAGFAADAFLAGDEGPFGTEGPLEASFFAATAPVVSSPAAFLPPTPGRRAAAEDPGRGDFSFEAAEAADEEAPDFEAEGAVFAGAGGGFPSNPCSAGTSFKRANPRERFSGEHLPGYSRRVGTFFGLSGYQTRTKATEASSGVGNPVTASTSKTPDFHCDKNVVNSGPSSVGLTKYMQRRPKPILQ